VSCRLWEEVHVLESSLSCVSSLSSSPREPSAKESATTGETGDHGTQGINSDHLLRSKVLEDLQGVKDALHETQTSGLAIKMTIEAARFSAERRAGRYAQELKKLKRRQLAGIYPFELETQLAQKAVEKSALELQMSCRNKDLKAARLHELLNSWRLSTLEARHANELEEREQEWQSGVQLYVRELRRDFRLKILSFRAWCHRVTIAVILKQKSEKLALLRCRGLLAKALKNCAHCVQRRRQNFALQSALVRWDQSRVERSWTCWYEVTSEMAATRADIEGLAKLHMVIRGLRMVWSRWRTYVIDTKTLDQKALSIGSRRSFFMLATAVRVWKLACDYSHSLCVAGAAVRASVRAHLQQQTVAGWSRLAACCFAARRVATCLHRRHSLLCLLEWHHQAVASLGLRRMRRRCVSCVVTLRRRAQTDKVLTTLLVSTLRGKGWHVALARARAKAVRLCLCRRLESWRSYAAHRIAMRHSEGVITARRSGSSEPVRRAFQSWAAHLVRTLRLQAMDDRLAKIIRRFHGLGCPERMRRAAWCAWLSWLWWARRRLWVEARVSRKCAALNFLRWWRHHKRRRMYCGESWSDIKM